MEEKMKVRADGKAECIGVYLGKYRCMPMQYVKRREGLGEITLLNAAYEDIPLTFILSPRNTWGEGNEGEEVRSIRDISVSGIEPLTLTLSPINGARGKRGGGSKMPAG
jgi:hypothetical protein